MGSAPSVQANSGPQFRTKKYAQVRKNIQEAKYYNTKAGIAQSIDQFNQAAFDISQKYHIHFINLTALTRTNIDPKYFAKDGIHYSPLMYEKWVEHILPIAEALITH